MTGVNPSHEICYYLENGYMIRKDMMNEYTLLDLVHLIEGNSFMNKLKIIISSIDIDNAEDEEEIPMQNKSKQKYILII